MSQSIPIRRETAAIMGAPLQESLLESMPLAVVTTDDRGRILYTNSRLDELFGYARGELLGHSIEILMPERFRTLHEEHRTRYMDTPHVRGMGSGMDLAGRRKNGSEFPLEAGLSYVNTDNGLIIITSIMDISRRKQTEEMLETRVQERTRELERRRAVSDGLRDTLAILNSNRAQEEILDHITDQACRLLFADAAAIYSTQDEGPSFALKSSHGMKAVTSADEFRALLSVPMVVKGEIYGTLMVYYIQPRKFSPEEIELAMAVGDQAALAIENARLRTQVERAAVTAERNRIARDLHDSVTQTLFSATLITEALPRLWRTNMAESERRLEELRQLTRGALAEMRTLLLELRPATLTEVRLAELLRQLTEATIGRARMPIVLATTGECDPPPDIKIALYHIAQEALNNVAKHARATEAAVTLICTGGRVALEVEDNGRGFHTDAISPEHLGLTIMRERAEGIGARLSIESRVDQGTRVRVEWENQEDEESL
ncbi:MAG: PAS domain S-box protein [Caldilineaceae bacterium]|nr:PAS domain S-box protein [Caldilineaceae bacterium]